jgi:hypothetical protein
MKQYFKDSNIYQKYKKERDDEAVEDKMNDETEESVQ